MRRLLRTVMRRRVLAGIVATMTAGGGYAAVGPREVLDLARSLAPAIPAAKGGQEEGSGMPGDRVRGPFRVAEVVDGGAIRVAEEDRGVTIRLIGLEAPEAEGPRGAGQCYGPEAAEHAAQELDGEMVYLEEDPSQGGVDKRGRSPAYVWTSSGGLFNEEMVREGFAYQYTSDKPYRYQKRLRDAEDDARDHGRGLWAQDTCDGKTGRRS